MSLKTEHEAKKSIKQCLTKIQAIGTIKKSISSPLRRYKQKTRTFRIGRSAITYKNSYLGSVGTHLRT